jgi:[ribosomal protein S5]-alanine N-acetyltransferase
MRNWIRPKQKTVIQRQAVMLDIPEVLRRLDRIVPGAAADGPEPFAGAEIYFERLSLSGTEEMHRYSIDERLYEFLEFTPFRSLDETAGYITKLLGRMSDDQGGRSAMYWFVRRKIDNRLVGTAGLVGLDYHRRSITWGYGVDPELWGLGHVLQLQALLKHYTFEVLQLNRLSGWTMVENERTIASVLSAGMRQEGIMRDYYFKDGVYHDAFLYAMVADDYFEGQPGVAATTGGCAVDDVIRVVASVLTEDLIDAESGIENTPSWDSIYHMDIMVAISEELGVTLSPSEAMAATSVKAIVDILAAKV